MELNAFTVDLEDGLSIAMRDQFNIQIPITDRVEKSAYLILSLLNKNNIKSTFFVVGKVAEAYPDLIREIFNSGHEIGLHGYEHLPYWNLSYEKVYQEIKNCKDTLESIIGSEVLGHRAPCFSINSDNIWILDIIAELGIKYDSSILPIRKVAYNDKIIGKSITRIKTASGELIEVPISTFSFMGLELPFSGGTYLRLLPFFLEKMAFFINNQKQTNILYIHPYELDTEEYPPFYYEQFNKLNSFKKMKIRTKFINRGKTYGKLETLIRNHKFCSMIQVLKEKDFI